MLSKLVIIILAATCIYLSWAVIQKNNPLIPTKLQVRPINTPKALEGQIAAINKEAKSIDLKMDSNLTTVKINDQTAFFTEQGKIASISYLQPGFTIKVFGTVDSQQLSADQIRVTKAPGIIIFAPGDNDIVAKSFKVSGIAKTSGDQLILKISTSTSSASLLTMTTQTELVQPGSYGQFAFPVNIYSLPLNIGDSFLVTIYQTDPNKNPIDTQTLHLTLTDNSFLF